MLGECVRGVVVVGVSRVRQGYTGVRDQLFFFRQQISLFRQLCISFGQVGSLFRHFLI